jgi:hypothetical protein
MTLGCRAVGVLFDPHTGRRITLRSHCVLGRHRRCDVQVDDPQVSGEHACLDWTGDCWELRDLGSRNGTFVDGLRLGPRDRVGLQEGAVFSLGGPVAGFTLLHASAPIARARSTDGRVREASAGQMWLPDDDHPLANVFEDSSGGWVAELLDEARAVKDQDVVTVDGVPWTLELPETLRATVEREIAAPTIETIDLRLGVSRDEEDVEVTVIHAGQATRLPARSAHYLLVVLARARLADRESPEADRGWVERQTLCRMLRCDPNKLGVDIFRIRKQFADLGILGAADIVARRTGTGQVRLGIERVEVYTR